MFNVARTAFYSAALFALAQSILPAQSPPVLTASYPYGGAGDQYGYGLAKSGPDVYLSGSAGGSTLLLKLSAPDGSIVWTASPVETLFQHDVTVDASNAYSVGGAVPPVCGAVDGVGDTEAKSLFGDLWCCDRCPRPRGYGDIGLVSRLSSTFHSQLADAEVGGRQTGPIPSLLSAQAHWLILAGVRASIADKRRAL